MKILINLTYYHPYVSGISEYARRLAEGLHRNGASVSVVCCRNRDKQPYIDEIAGVKIRRFIPTIKANKFMVSAGVIFWMGQNINKFDRVIINLPYPEAVPAAFLAKIFRKEIITVFHCDLMLGQAVFEKILEVTAILSNIICLAMSKRVVVNSLDYSQSVWYLRYFKKKTVEIYPPPAQNPIPNSQSRPAYSDKTAKRTSIKKLTIGYLGRISKEKNLESLLTAVRDDKKARLLIAGPVDVPGEDDYYSRILNMAIGSDKIRIIGQLRQEQLENFFNAIDILALPSDNRTESFGMVQVEAMLAGVPVIATNRPGIRIPIQKTGAGLLIEQPRNINEWKDKFRQAENDLVNLTGRTRKAGKIFGFEKFIEKWRRLIYEIQN